jgi:hypothetical protein
MLFRGDDVGVDFPGKDLAGADFQEKLAGEGGAGFFVDGAARVVDDVVKPEGELKRGG